MTFHLQYTDVKRQIQNCLTRGNSNKQKRCELGCNSDKWNIKKLSKKLKIKEIFLTKNAKIKMEQY